MTNHEHHKRGYVNDEDTCLPTHHIHVEREKRYNPFDEFFFFKLQVKLQKVRVSGLSTAGGNPP